MPPQPFQPDVPVPTVSSAPEGALMRWGRWLLIAAPVAALLFATGSASFPLSSAKFALFATLAALSSIALTVSAGAALLSRSRGRLELLLAALLPAVYLLSWWFSTDRSVALIGIGSETDTVLFVLTAFGALVLSFLYIRTGSSLKALLLIVAGAAGVALIFQYANVLVGVPGEAFSDPSANLVGKWNDFGMVTGVLALLSLGFLELMPLSRRAVWGAWIVLALSLLMLGAVNFSTGWWMLLGASALCALGGYLARGAGVGRRIPWAPAIVGIVSVAFLLAGGQINTALTSVLQVASLEVRPALSSTIDIGRASHDSATHSLFGTGPNTFNQQWLAYKPTEVNQTQFWSVDFASGFSLLSSAFVTVGYLGVIGWLVPLVLVLLALWRLARSSGLSSSERALGLIAGLSALYLWSAFILYSPSPATVLLGFVLAGATLGYSSALRGTREYASRTSWLIASGALLALVLISAYSALAADRRFLSLMYSQQALVSVQGGDLAAGEELLVRSLSIERIGENLRLGAEISLARMVAVAQSTTTPAVDAQQQFAAAVQTAVSLAQEAAALNPKDYRPYLQLASVYRYLASLNVEGALASEMAAYAKAQELNGKNPAIPLLRAQLEAQNPQGSASAIETYLTQSLQLKSNYTDALLFAVQLAVAQNNLTTAIQAQTAAVASAPDQATLWYQLGLLYYVGGDMENAVLALDKALSLVPDYANAQYFLGLSHYRQGNTEGAIKQFTTLSASNPDNASVTKILENLRAGKDPLEGVADAPGATAQ